MMPAKPKDETQSGPVHGWWDFYPLIDSVQRPVQWSSTSTIFSPHAIRPIVLGRVFASPTEFVLPPAPPIRSSPESYDPPTIISACPDGLWVFAYFPGLFSVDAVAVLWKRGSQVDEWFVKDSWRVPRSAGVVAAGWACTEREWATDSAGSSIRLPPRGPRASLSPILLLVTQSYHLTIGYFPQHSSLLKTTTHPLTSYGGGQESQGNPQQDTMYGRGGVKICSKAAIGFGYNDSSVLVAIRPTILPASSAAYNPADPYPPLGLSDSSISEPEAVIEWGEEPSIELFDIQLNFDSALQKFTCNPLSTFHLSDAHLAHISFICIPPAPSKSEPQGDIPETQSAMVDESDRGRIYLCTSFLDFGDYSSTPKSELSVHSLSRSNSPGKPPWLVRHEATRSFASGMLAFFAPTVAPNISNTGLFVGVLDTSITMSAKTNLADAGKLVVLKLPDLGDDEDWDNSSIFSSVGSVEGDLPLNAVISPNGTLICTISSSMQSTRTSIHRLPTRKQKHSSGLSSDSKPRPHLSFVLASAIRSRKSIADISHILSLTSTHVSEAVEVIYHTMSILEEDNDGLTNMRTWEVLGVLVEIYRTKSLNTTKGADRDKLTARWQTAHDMCSIVASNMAFDDCKEGELYDIEAVWQLLGLSSWFIDFLGRLMKDSVMFGSDNLISQPTAEGDDPFIVVPSVQEPQPLRWEMPILLHLVQPYALTNLLGMIRHVKRFRNYLGSLTPKGEKAQIVKDILVDIVDCSGIDLAALDTVLTSHGQDVKAEIDVDDARRSLASCHPTSSMEAILRKVVQAVADSTVLDRSLLFIKPSDLMDGSSVLNGKATKEKGRDVVSKGLLVKERPTLHCRGCGGRSEVGGNIRVAGHISLRWIAWEREWIARCICGGTWTVAGH